MGKGGQKGTLGQELKKLKVFRQGMKTTRENSKTAPTEEGCNVSFTWGRKGVDGGFGPEENLFIYDKQVGDLSVRG